MKPKILLEIQGGEIKKVTANGDVDVRVLDYDLEEITGEPPKAESYEPGVVRQLTDEQFEAYCLLRPAFRGCDGPGRAAKATGK